MVKNKAAKPVYLTNQSISILNIPWYRLTCMTKKGKTLAKISKRSLIMNSTQKDYQITLGLTTVGIPND